MLSETDPPDMPEPEVRFFHRSFSCSHLYKLLHRAAHGWSGRLISGCHKPGYHKIAPANSDAKLIGGGETGVVRRRVGLTGVSTLQAEFMRVVPSASGP